VRRPKSPLWLWSGTATVAIVGFALNLFGVLGGALYVDPAQRELDATSLEIALQSARSRMILAATADSNLAETLGSSLFSISIGSDPPARVRETIGDLMRRAFDRRHEATRAYIAELAVAGAVNFQAASRTYDALVDAERAAFNIGAYRAVNAFESELSARMVKAQGEAAMKAITLQRDRAKAKAVAASRMLTLVLVSLAGSAIVFVAAMAHAQAPEPPLGAQARILTIARRRLRARCPATEGDAA
jgi:hypothetical protein